MPNSTPGPSTHSPRNPGPVTGTIRVPPGIDPNAAMMVAINLRPNQTPGRFIGIALVRHPSVQRVVADSTARRGARVGMAGSAAPWGSVTFEMTSLIVPFVNGIVNRGKAQ
ncbi:hypothetical protein MNVM_02830 [Mycobacterium novum]|uniref:Uncharacterized protein n=1 Tax=Mycobacterium novum TaxID=2492438 RepID=A0A7I7JJR5_9MYCO|nr:hypothetical protein MNVM_02830 [Mycobacterium novum]